MGLSNAQLEQERGTSLEQQCEARSETLTHRALAMIASRFLSIDKRQTGHDTVSIERHSDDPFMYKVSDINFSRDLSITREQLDMHGKQDTIVQLGSPWFARDLARRRSFSCCLVRRSTLCTRSIIGQQIGFQLRLQFFNILIGEAFTRIEYHHGTRWCAFIAT